MQIVDCYAISDLLDGDADEYAAIIEREQRALDSEVAAMWRFYNPDSSEAQ